MPGPQQNSGKIPSDAHFVLRTEPPTRWLRLGLSLVPATISTLIAVPAIASGRLSAGQDVRVIVTVVVAILAGLLYWQVRTTAQLAADKHGIWVRAQWWPTRAIFLPWNEVSQLRPATGNAIAIKPGSAILVVPHDDRSAGRGLGLLADLEQSWNNFRFGGRLVARIPVGSDMESTLNTLAGLTPRRAVDPPSTATAVPS